MQIVNHRNIRQTKLNLDLNVSDHPPVFKSETVPTLLTSKSKNKTITLKDKRQPKSLSVLKSKQPISLGHKITGMKFKNNFDKKITPIPIANKVDDLTTLVTERKRPSILRRSKSALVSHHQSNVENGTKHETTIPLGDGSERFRNTARDWPCQEMTMHNHLVA